MHNQIIYFNEKMPQHLQEYAEFHRLDNSQIAGLFYRDNILFYEMNGDQFYVDYVHEWNKLNKQSIGANDLLAKALGVKNASGKRFVDATCGLGSDLVYASLFFTDLKAYERQIEIYLLNLDALHRLGDLGERKISLVFGELQPQELTENDVVFYDPMYPAQRKSKSLAKKNMELLKILCGDDSDQIDFFKKLLASKSRRVVVKRPIRGDVFEKKYLTTQFKGKNIRFDVYCK